MALKGKVPLAHILCLRDFTIKNALALVRSLYQKQKHHFLVCSHGIPLFFYGFSYDLLI